MSNFEGKTCPFCKSEINPQDNVKVCPSCGMPHHQSCWEENNGCTTFGCSEQHLNSVESNDAGVCDHCKAPIAAGQAFCPNCGQSIGQHVDDAVAAKINQLNAKATKKNKKKFVIPAVIGGIILVLVIGFFLRGTPVKSISLSRSSATVRVGESVTLFATIYPSDATHKTVTWESGNTSVAKVDGGVVRGISEGTSTIIAKSNNGKTQSCTITVIDVIDFNKHFAVYKEEIWCDLASDGSYVMFDSNPLDYDNIDYPLLATLYLTDTLDAVKKALTDLGFSSSVYTKITETRSIDGRQNEENSKYKVSWTYHPDNGLEIMFEIR